MASEHLNISAVREELESSIGYSFPLIDSITDLQKNLSDYINQLINNDFNKLLLLLYRVDVNEENMKAILKSNPEADAGKLIADLIIERQLQKIQSRRQFDQRDKNISDDEKW